MIDLYEFRTADWAGSVLAEKADMRPDLGPDARTLVGTSSGKPISAAQGTSGRMEVTVFVVSDDPEIPTDSDEVAALRDRIFELQYERIPHLPDLPPDPSLSSGLAVSIGVSSALFFVMVAVLGGIAGLVRDRGSRELARAMFPPRRRTATALLVDHSGMEIRRGWLALLAWVLRTAILAALLGFLTWAPTLSIWAALAIFGGVMALISIGFAAIARRRAPRGDTRLTRREWTITAIGTAAGTVIWAGGVGMITAGAIATWFGGGAGLIVLIVPMTVVGAMIMAQSRSVSRFARRMIQPTLRRRIEGDGRQPVLLLRSFVDDQLEVRSSAASDSFMEMLAGEAYSRFEEGLAWALWRSGPVLTVGQPGTVVQPLGAARDYYSDDDWRGAVVERMEQAKRIVFVVGRSPSLMWEIEQVRHFGYLGKSIFVLPPVRQLELFKRLVVLDAALEMTDAIYPDTIDGYAILLTFDAEDGHPILHGSRARTTSAYIAALETAMDAPARVDLHAPAATFRASSVQVEELLEGFDPKRSRKARRSVATVLADIVLRF